MRQELDIANLDAGKGTQQLFGERLQRTLAAMALKQPDRIPILLGFGNGLADFAGATRREMMENAEKQNTCLLEAAQRFQPDIVFTYPFGPEMSRALGDRMTKWPGLGLEDNQSFQFHEQEFMKAEDYDDFINDLGDWTLRKYLPRTNSALEGLALLPPLGVFAGGFYGLTANLAKFSMPPVVSALEALAKAAQARMQWIQRLGGCIKLLAENGFPPSPLAGPLVHAPFDFMANTLRGMRGIFLDMRRCPEKLLAAEERVLNMQVDTAVADCKAFHLKSIMMFLHRGSDGFISLRDFEKFYWPQLKRTILRICDAGITPFIFWEGSWDQRLHYLTELPKGKTVGAFQSSDIFKVKQVLGDTMCIVGGMKVSLLSGAASAEEIREQTRKLCREVGKGGGFIMCTDIFELEGTNPEMVKVWIDATKEFGQY
jgi:uroporphyrinogen-III decarboxylase